MGTRFVAAAVAALLSGACSATGGDGGAFNATSLAGPSALPPAAEGSGAIRSDVHGDWAWRRSEVIRMPAFVATLVGIEPEGPNTHARCESEGTMTLVQSDSGFHGTAARTSNSCRTNGGQSFLQPGNAFLVTDGRIHGRSVQFSMANPPVTPCPHHATVAEIAGTLATALSGTARCVLPGHPQSPLSVEPPPGGTSVSVSFEAWRP